MDGINSRTEETEQRIRELEGRTIETTQDEQQKEQLKYDEKNKHTLRDQKT